MSNNQTIMVIPWGLPNWYLSKYKVGDDPIRLSNTTLFPLYESLLKSTQTEDITILLLVSDTLLSEIPNYLERINETISYNNVISLVREFIESKINEYYNNYIENNIDTKMSNLKSNFLTNLEIFVLPGFGSFQDKDNKLIWKFDGLTDDWLTYLYLKTFEIIEIKNLKITKIILDTTFGLNFSTIYTDMFTRELAEISFILNNDSENVILEVFNSDPYLAKLKDLNQLKINKIRTITIKNFNLDIDNSSPKWEFNPNLPNNKKSDIGKSVENFSFLNKVHMEVFFSVNSFLYPLPLLLISSIKSNVKLLAEKDIRHIFKNIETFLNQNISVEKKKNTISRGISINSNFVLLLLKYHILEKSVLKIIGHTDCKGATLNHLTKISEFYNKPLDILSSQEISTIDSAIKSKKGFITKEFKNKKIPLSAIYKKKVNDPKNDYTSKDKDLQTKVQIIEEINWIEKVNPKHVNIDRRIFIAHAGLTQDLVLFTINNHDEICLEYNDRLFNKKTVKSFF
jgi:hypothetical protein